MQRAHPGRPRHGIPASLFGVVTLFLPGFLAVAVAAFPDIFPESWLQYPEGMSQAGARAVAFAAGLGLLVVGRGYFAFTRVGWLGYVIWAVVSLVTFLTEIIPRSSAIVIAGFPLLVVLGLPYMWRRRGDFGIGPAATEARDW